MREREKPETESRAEREKSKLNLASRLYMTRGGEKEGVREREYK